MSGVMQVSTGAPASAAVNTDGRTTDERIPISFDRNPFDFSLDRLLAETDKLDDAAHRFVQTENLAGASILHATGALDLGRLLVVTRSGFLCRRACARL